jgi:penicillin-binding protein 2
MEAARETGMTGATGPGVELLAMMRGFLRRQIPSMFHRRLLLLLLAGLAVCLAIGAQAARLTLGPARTKHKQAAESALRAEKVIPTVRGRILDREGRVLAQDEPGWAAAVDYSVIAGSWSDRRGKTAARRAAGDDWRELTPPQRQRLIERHQQPFDKQVERLWERLTALRKAHEPAYTRSDLEQRKNDIRRRVQSVASHLWWVWRQQREQQLNKEVSLAEVAKPIREQTQAHVLLRDISSETRNRIQSRIAEAKSAENPSVWKQVQLKRPKQRNYPLETLTLEIDRSTLPRPLRREEPATVDVAGVGVHLLGRMRDVWESDLKGEGGRPFRREDKRGRTQVDLGGYLPGDRVGSFGIEEAYERRLRGERGRIIEHLDTGRADRLDPQAGADVRLTVDVRLQARVQALMSPATGLMEVQPWHLDNPEQQERLGEPLNGAAVVLDVQTSEVLAAVSVPPMPRKTLRQNPEQIFEDPYRLPYLNRPLARHYPPGSAVKPFMLLAAAAEGEYALGESIVCQGYLYDDQPERFRCWVWKQYGTGHGQLGAAASLERSCNVFYYTLGRRMGLARTNTWYRRFGLDRDTSITLEDESAGALPDPAKRRSPQQDAIYMGIGQGPVAWTPMQAASAYATLVRDGARLGPTLVKPADRKTARETERLPLNPEAVDEALDGLYRVVHAERGTGRQLQTPNPEPIFNVEGVDIFGKSGTADAGSRWIDQNRNGEVDPADEVIADAGDHAWFLAMPRPEGADRPRYVVAVVVEYAGSGAQVAGPVANQIVRALKTEGYL